MSPKIVNKENKRDEIAKIALELFAEKGIENTSIREITTSAGLGLGTFYLYFDTKEAIILATARLFVRNLKEILQQILKSYNDPELRLREGVKVLMKAHLADDKYAKITISMFQLVLSNRDFSKENNLIKELYRGFRKAIIDTILDGVSRGVFRPEAAKKSEMIAVNLAAFFDGLWLHYFMDRKYFDIDSQIDLYLDELMENLKMPHSR